MENLLIYKGEVEIKTISWDMFSSGYEYHLYRTNYSIQGSQKVLRQAYKKYSVIINCFSLIMVTMVLCHVIKFSNDIKREDIYISYLKEPNLSISIISKGKSNMSEIIH